MKLSRREMILAGLTLAALLGGGTAWLAEPMMKQWNNAAALRVKLEGERKESEHIINQRPDWELKLKNLRAQLPQHAGNAQVTSEILKTIKRLADANGLAVSRLQPGEETDLGDGLSEVAIDCQWDADLSGLVHFLYAVQVQGAILDIRQLTVQPQQGMAGRLKGNFTVFNAFSRAKSDQAMSGTGVPEAGAPASPQTIP
ncbi:MAG: GspMb/PilO family protein [bacterium]